MGRAPSFIVWPIGLLFILGTEVRILSGQYMLSIIRSRPFRNFQRQIGNSTFYINTAYIGLEWVARGKGKPEGIEINWSPPNSPRQIVDQARSLLHSAMLGHASDALDTYLRSVGDDPWLKRSDHQRAILRKAVTKSNSHAYSVAERFSELGVTLDAEAKLDLAMVAALVAWRNQIIHVTLDGAGSKLRIDGDTEGCLKSGKLKLGRQYGNLDSEVMLRHMRERRAPKRKEIIALVSAAQNLTHTVDRMLLRSVLPGSDAVEEIAMAVIREALCKDKEIELRKLWGKNRQARGRRLRAVLEQGGFTTSSDSEAPSLPSNFLEKLADMSIKDLSEALIREPQ